jgi:hypothetical protein
VGSPEQLHLRESISIQPSQVKAVLGEHLEAALFNNARTFSLHNRLVERLKQVKRLEYSVVAEFHASSDKDIVFPIQGGASEWCLLQNKNIHYFNHTFAPCERAVSPSEMIQRLARKGLSEVAFGPAGMRLVFRDICRNDDTRTLITCLVPPGFVSTYDTPMVVPSEVEGVELRRSLLRTCGFLSSFVGDFLVRPYIDKHLKGYVLKRVPIPDLLDVDGGQGIQDCVEALVADQFEGTTSDYDERRAELDARCALIAGCTPNDIEVMLDSFESLRNDETSRFGEYRTFRLIHQALRRLET